MNGAATNMANTLTKEQIQKIIWACQVEMNRLKRECESASYSDELTHAIISQIMDFEDLIAKLKGEL